MTEKAKTTTEIQTLATKKKHRHAWSLKSELVEACKGCDAERPAVTARVYLYGLGDPVYGHGDCPLCAGKDDEHWEKVRAYAEERKELAEKLDKFNAQLPKASEDKAKKIKAAQKVAHDRCGAILDDLYGDFCGAHLFRRQLRLGHDYRNALACIYRKSGEVYRDIIGNYSEEQETLQEEVDALGEQLKAARTLVKADKRNKEAKAIVKELKAKRRPLYVRLKEIKESIKKDPEVQARIKANDDVLHKGVRDLREQFRINERLFWGSYLLREKSAEQSKYTPGRRKDPVPVRWEGSGYVGLQLLNGLPVADAWGTDTRFQLRAVPEDTWTRLREDGAVDRAYRRQNCRTTVRFRIGSKERTPIWVEFPVAVHRPLPPDGVIKWAKVIQERVGTHYKYSLHVTVEMRKERKVKRPGVVGINLGWRRTDDGLRIAYWHGDDGQHGELFLPPKCAREDTRIADIQKVRDRNLNELKETLATWLERLKPGLPTWVKEHRGIWHVREWRSAARFAGFVHKWRRNRFGGDETIYEKLEAWRKSDKLLYDKQSFMRRKLALRRHDVYRNFAADLAREYGKVAVDNTDYRRFGRKKPPESASEEETNTLRARAKLAAPGLLRRDLINACNTHKAVAHKVDAAYITKTCHECGEINDWDQSLSVTHWCTGCGAFWDQDHNAAINLCRLGGGNIPSKPKPKPIPRKPPRSPSNGIQVSASL